LPKQGQPSLYGNVTYKDQVREALLPSSPLGTAATGAEGAAGANDVPFVSAVAVGESRIAAEEREDRLQAAERRAAAAKAARQDQEVRLAQLERQMANENNNNNSRGSSPKQLSQRQRCCIVVVVVVVVTAAAVVAGICGTERCSAPATARARSHPLLYQQHYALGSNIDVSEQQ
jgi:hypothetical protein